MPYLPPLWNLSLSFATFSLFCPLQPQHLSSGSVFSFFKVPQVNRRGWEWNGSKGRPLKHLPMSYGLCQVDPEEMLRVECDLSRGRTFGGGGKYLPVFWMKQRRDLVCLVFFRFSKLSTLAGDLKRVKQNFCLGPIICLLFPSCRKQRNTERPKWNLFKFCS